MTTTLRNQLKQDCRCNLPNRHSATKIATKTGHTWSKNQLGIYHTFPKSRFRWVSNPGPFACEANVITTTLRNQRKERFQTNQPKMHTSSFTAKVEQTRDQKSGRSTSHPQWNLAEEVLSKQPAWYTFPFTFRITHDIAKWTAYRKWIRTQLNQPKWPRGLMDKVSDFESEDCEFESRRGLLTILSNKIPNDSGSKHAFGISIIPHTGTIINKPYDPDMISWQKLVQYWVMLVEL